MIFDYKKVEIFDGEEGWVTFLKCSDGNWLKAFSESDEWVEAIDTHKELKAKYGM